jgi:hypothetical protein
MKIRSGLFAIAVVLLLSACGTQTPYQPRGMTGGYTETRITDSSYQVKFFGNGFTSRDKVWYYWIYRCAELTKANGYTGFFLTSDKPAAPATSSADDAIPTMKAAAALPGDQSGYANAKGVSYIYVPSYGGSYGSITTYSASGIVQFLREPVPDSVSYYRVKTILELLKPYVDSQGLTKAPSTEEVILKSLVLRKSYTQGIDTPNSRGASLDDFKDLLPAGK